jgi:hypothetical protein
MIIPGHEFAESLGPSEVSFLPLRLCLVETLCVEYGYYLKGLKKGERKNQKRENGPRKIKKTDFASRLAAVFAKFLRNVGQSRSVSQYTNHRTTTILY